MKIQLFALMVAASALVGCDSNRNNVQEANKELSETRQEATKDVSEAQGAAVKDVNEAKQEAADDIKEAQGDLQKAKRDAAEDGTSSGTTTGDSKDVKVTAEQCAQFATNKTITPENRELYEACSKIDKKTYSK